MKGWIFGLFYSRREIVEVKSCQKKELESDLLLHMSIVWKYLIALLFSKGTLRLGNSF